MRADDVMATGTEQRSLLFLLLLLLSFSLFSAASDDER